MEQNVYLYKFTRIYENNYIVRTLFTSEDFSNKEK